MPHAESRVALCECGTMLFGRDRWELEAAARRCFAEHPHEPLDGPRGKELRRRIASVLTQLNLVSHAEAGSAPAAPPVRRVTVGMRARSPHVSTGGDKPPGGVDRYYDFEDDDAWRLRSVEHFRERLDRAESVRDLELLLEEAWEALGAWQGTLVGWDATVARLTLCGEPDRQDSQWKRWVAVNVDTAEELARKSKNGVTAEEVLAIRRAYAGTLGVRSYRQRVCESDDPERLPAPRLLIGAAPRKPDDDDLWSDDDDKSSDAAPPRIAPLVVVEPRKLPPVPKHPYQDTPQYEESLTPSESGLPGEPLQLGPVSKPKRDDLSFVFGELHCYGITSDGRPNQKVEQDTQGESLPGQHRIRRRRSPGAALEVLLDWRPGGSEYRFRGCLRRGPKSAAMRADYDDLASRVAGAVTARMTTIEAIANDLGCNAKTVDALVAAGKIASVHGSYFGVAVGSR